MSFNFGSLRVILGVCTPSVMIDFVMQAVSFTFFHLIIQVVRI